MKKWFNTNYHYLVPEIEGDCQIKLADTKPFDEFIKARERGWQSLGAILWQQMRQTTDYLGRCLPHKTDNGDLVGLCPVPYHQTRKRYAYRPYNYFKLVLSV